MKNPQYNVACERMHYTMGSILQSETAKIQDEDKAAQAIDNALHTCIRPMRCAVKRNLQTSPGDLVFNRYMMMDAPLISDINSIRGRRQQQIDDSLLKMNKKRIDYHYKVGESVWIKEYEPRKMHPRLHGPYPIAKVYTNGTVDINNIPTTTDKYNILRIHPYKHLVE